MVAGIVVNGSQFFHKNVYLCPKGKMRLMLEDKKDATGQIS